MALDVYFRDDIKNILRATLVASEGSAALVGDLLQDPDLDQAMARKLMQVYKQGFASALGAVALAFGLDVPPFWTEVEAPAQTPSSSPARPAGHASVVLLAGRKPSRRCYVSAGPFGAPRYT